MNDVMVDVEGRTLKLTNLDKVLYPATGTTKGEVLNYYAQVAPVLLPHLAGRAVTRIRWPNGVSKPSFFEKNVPSGTPRWVRTVTVPTTGSRSGGDAGDLTFPVVDSLATLTWLVQLAAIELHVHQWRVADDDSLLPPDRLVIDLDPGEGAGLDKCSEVALLVREALDERDLDCLPVTSGSKGLHLYAYRRAGRRKSRPDFESSSETTGIAKELAEALEKAHPKLVTATMTKARRTNKVFLDWSQNAGSKTTLTPYSLRGKDRPTAATPLTWAEVEEGADDPLALEQFGFEQTLARVAEHGDLFAV